MKVLQITNNYPTAKFPIFGIFVREQIDSLRDLGVESDIFFMNTREGGKKEYLRSLFRLQKLFSQNKYDLVHCHHSYSAIVFLLSGTIFGKRCILSYQSDPGKESGKFLFNILYRFFDLIILKNRSRELNCPKTIYLPNGVNTSFFRPMEKISCKRQLGLSENKRYIVFMDSYNRRPFKRIDRYKEAIRILREEYSFPDLEPLVLTNTERSLIPVFLCASDLHLLTSDFEGSPNSVKECLACNVPVVSTPVGNVAELLSGIEGSYVSKSFEPEELAQLACKALMKNHYSSRNSIIEKELDIKVVGSKLYNIYKDLIQNQ